MHPCGQQQPGFRSSISFSERISSRAFLTLARTVLLLSGLHGVQAMAAPKIVLISIDGATPRLVERYLDQGVLPSDRGLGLLRAKGVSADQNLTTTPSLTAPGHMTIATGSEAARHDVPANSFHLLATPIATRIGGWRAPIGGYDIDARGPAEYPSATPIWEVLRAAGKKVAIATFPGADATDVYLPGFDKRVIQPASMRMAGYTIPYGEVSGPRGRGFALNTADFTPAPRALVDELAAAGHRSFSPVLQVAGGLEKISVGGIDFPLGLAALDTRDDGKPNYDTLVFFNATGIGPGPFALPATGPAYVEAGTERSSRLYLDGSSNQAGTAFYVSHFAPDLSALRLVRYAVASLPRNPATLEFVDDINRHVGFWPDEPDFHVIDGSLDGLGEFSRLEREAIYMDQVETFVDYQSRLAVRAIERNPDADLLMTYIEEPDGASHQFLLTDPRQTTNPRDPTATGAAQDPAVLARYRSHVERAYQAANAAVQRIIEAVGTRPDGSPASNVIAVSDHGFDSFHTAVSVGQLLATAGIPASTVMPVHSGAALNLYINLAGREPNGVVKPEDYPALQVKLVALLRGLIDTNPAYASESGGVPVFAAVHARPLPRAPSDPPLGRATSELIAQDSGDVFALLAPGYNFAGAQRPPIMRVGDTAQKAPILSVPDFHGTHGYDPALPNMSAIFYAAGPDIGRGRIELMRNIDIAPTIAELLGVAPPATVQGRGMAKQLRAIEARSAQGGH